MSTHKGTRPIDPATAEQLISGGTAAWRTGHHRLAGLLAAASAPGRPDELAGLDAALAAFTGAAHDLVPQPRRWHMIKASLAKFLTVKVIAVCAATLSVGGVAVAASTGNLPGPLNFADAPAPTHAGRPSGVPSGSPSHLPPAPGLQRLCRDYLGRDHEHRRQALGDQAFHELVDRVGGKDRDKADSFCDKLLRDGATPMPSAPPSGGPGAFPTTWPTGGHGASPTARPAGGATAAPTGGPNH